MKNPSITEGEFFKGLRVGDYFRVTEPPELDFSPEAQEKVLLDVLAERAPPTNEQLFVKLSDDTFEPVKV